MRRFLALLAVLLPALALATPRTFSFKLSRDAPASGPSTAATLTPGYYTMSVTGERSCLCIGTTTCDDSEAKAGICIQAGDRIELRVPGTTSQAVSVWSLTGSGHVDVLGWTP